MAWRAASCATCWAAYAVLLREPLKPTRPALDQPITCPCMSVMLTWVLLNVARIFAIPLTMFLAPLALTIFLPAKSSASNSAAVGAAAAAGAAPSAGAAAGASAAAAGAPAGAAPSAAAGAAAFLPFGAAASPVDLAAGFSPAASGFASFLGAAFFGFSSAIVLNQLEIEINGYRSWRLGCAPRRPFCADLCACGRWSG